MDVQELKERVYGFGPVSRTVTVGHRAETWPLRMKLARLCPDFPGAGEQAGGRPGRQSDPAQLVEKFLVALEAYEDAIFKAKRVDHKTFLADDALRLNERAAQWFRALPRDTRRDVRPLLESCDPLFLNRSLFGEASGLVLSHNFSPSLDPAALVCTKRLREMQSAFDGGISWQVVSQDMSSNTTIDTQFDDLYGRFSATGHRVMHEENCNGERVAHKWGRHVFEFVKDEEYDICYSHAMYAASHVAGRLYKQAHPNTVWIAEMGDPLYIATDGKPRLPTEDFTGDEAYLNTFWHDVEADTLREADVIIFNNEGLRDLVLECTHDREMARRAADKVVIAPNCTIDSRCVQLVNKPMNLDESRINMAYLGSINASRPFEPLDRLLENERVELYLFLAMDWNTVPIFDKLPKSELERIHFCDPVTHLEALNVCAQMDYCLVNDTLFPRKPNPYHPSKYYDYVAAGCPIIAFTQPGSPIDRDVYDGLLRVHTAEEVRALALSLTG